MAAGSNVLMSTPLASAASESLLLQDTTTTSSERSTTEIISSANALLAAHAALLSQTLASQQNRRRRLYQLRSPLPELTRLPLIEASVIPVSPVDDDEDSESTTNMEVDRPDLPPAKRARLARYKHYIPEEETIRNDYSQRYVDSGDWPQNWVLGAEPEHRFEEYPKQQRLLALKKAAVAACALPPYYLPYGDLASLSALHKSKFDVILLDPPLSSSFTWDDVQALPIPALAAEPSFVFMWVGSGAGEGLERGREVLAKWGYRRCEDVVWVKTNKRCNAGPGTDPPTTSLLTRTKQHCLIGIRGTVRRSTDSWFVHCNVDTDVLVWEGDPADPSRKPPEMYSLVENFCLGTRRLEIFGRAASSIRRGWVTVLAPGQETFTPLRTREEDDNQEEMTAIPWTHETWDHQVRELAAANNVTNGNPTNIPKCVVPMSGEIDALRPKSPFRPGSNNNNGGNNGNNRQGGGFGGGNNGPMQYQPQPQQIGNGMMMGMGGGLNMDMMNNGMGNMGGMNMGNMGMGGMNMGNMGGMVWPGMMGMNGMGMNPMSGMQGMGGMNMMNPMQYNGGVQQGQGGGGAFNPTLFNGAGWVDPNVWNGNNGNNGTGGGGQYF